MGLPARLSVQTAPGPQGDGWQGSGRTTHRWLWHTYPLEQSGSLQQGVEASRLSYGLFSRNVKGRNKCCRLCTILERKKIIIRLTLIRWAEDVYVLVLFEVK